MTTLSQFAGGARVPKVLINSTSTTGSTANTVNTGAVHGVKKTVSGALTANTLSTVLSITGGGTLCFASCYGNDATSRTHRFKLTLDGVVVYDATTAAVAATSSGIMLVGITAVGVYSTDAIPFNVSCLLEYASSVTETGLTNFAYLYRTN